MAIHFRRKPLLNLFQPPQTKIKQLGPSELGIFLERLAAAAAGSPSDTSDASPREEQGDQPVAVGFSLGYMV